MKKNTKTGKKKRPPEKAPWIGKALALGLALVLGAVLLVLAKRDDAVPRGPAEVEPSRERPSSQASGTRVPPFHEDADQARPFPETLSPSLFDDPVVARAYRVAGEIKEVLVQQPCYCFCQGHGHRSLLDCYTDYHGAG